MGAPLHRTVRSLGVVSRLTLAVATLGAGGALAALAALGLFLLVPESPPQGLRRPGRRRS